MRKPRYFSRLKPSEQPVSRTFVGQVDMGGEWVNVCAPSTLQRADDAAFMAAVSLAQGGRFVESRVVNIETGEIDHEHAAPRFYPANG